MTGLDPTLAPGPFQFDSGGDVEISRELASSWRRLTRAATFVALLTSPALVAFFMRQNHWPLWKALIVTLVIVGAFRGLLDLLFRRFIPWPSLFGLESQQHREEDVLARRRAWFWSFWFRLGLVFVTIVTVVWIFQGGTWVEALQSIFHGIGHVLSSPQLWIQAVFVFFLFFANFAILMGPLLLMNLAQMQAFEPGDAEWGVKLDDVRGQAEAKEEVRRVVTIWQSGEAFERAGGKRERGLLFLGAPGTGKTMLAKALATGFNSPFVSMPGSGFAATFIGIDAIVVRVLARRAKKLARKWGGQCIVFIDEIDAVGMRRQAVQGQMTALDAYAWRDVSDFSFYGPWGAQNPTGDLIVETRRWRERLFDQRSPSRWTNPIVDRIVNQFPGGMMGGMGQGQLALNQLLVVMDGIDNPPFFRRLFTNWTNTLLDASYIIPAKAGRFSLRVPRPKPRKDQIYFIGATNVPISQLDPALTRPGRMGRHVWLRTPTKIDRKDILDLYIGKVAHEAELDEDKKRDELARITGGYSPAMLEQVCSMALTYAHADGRERFDSGDILEAMTTVESGTAVNIEYPEEDTRAVALHESGHAAASHVYMKGTESTRISIRMRGESLGHHQAAEQVEHFSQWRSDQMATLIWGLGAMAAERVFYGQTTSGVGGDIQTVTRLAALMVGAAGMGPEPLELGDRSDAMEEERVLKRFEEIGLKLMNRTGSIQDHDVAAGVLMDRDKRSLAAQLVGQAYVTAHNFVQQNRTGIEKIADEVVARREIYGDELVELLDRAKLEPAKLDLLEEKTWPML